MPVAVQITGVAGSEPTVDECRLGRLIILIIPLENGAAGNENLLVRRDPDLNAGQGFSDGLRLDLIVRLDLKDAARFGQTVTLLQIQTDRAEEGDHVGADGVASRVGASEIRAADPIEERAVDDQCGQAMKGLEIQRHRFLPDLTGDHRTAHAFGLREEPPLDPSGIRHPDP